MEKLSLIDDFEISQKEWKEILTNIDAITEYTILDTFNYEIFIIEMIEYAALNGFISIFENLGQYFTKLMTIIQSPAGLTFIAAIFILFFVFKR